MFFHAFWSGYILRYSGPYCIVKESCAVLRATASAMRVLHRGQHNTPSEGARASFKPLEARNSPNPRACFLVSKATAKGFTEGAGHRPRIPASRHWGHLTNAEFRILIPDFYLDFVDFFTESFNLLFQCLASLALFTFRQSQFCHLPLSKTD